LEDLCSARTDVRLPWGRTRPNDLIRTVGAVARVVMSASNSHDSALDLTADRRPGSVKDFAFETAGAQRVDMSLPTRLRHRQWVLARVAHVLRWAPEARTFQPHGQQHRSSGWHRCADGPKGRSLGCAPKQPTWSGDRTSCEGNSASHPSTSRPTRPYLHRSSEPAGRLGFEAADEVPFADYSFRLAVYSFKFAVYSFFDTWDVLPPEHKIQPVFTISVSRSRCYEFSRSWLRN
jgi:hypothetical protein